MVAEATAPRHENVPMAHSFLLYRKYRVTLKCESHDSYRAKSPSGGSHCGGMESCRLCDPPQAENPASQDSFLFALENDMHGRKKETSYTFSWK